MLIVDQEATALLAATVKADPEADCLINIICGYRKDIHRTLFCLLLADT